MLKSLFNCLLSCFLLLPLAQAKAPYTISYDYGDGSAIQNGTLGDRLSHTYNSPGTYTLRGTIRDADGIEKVKIQTITVNSTSTSTSWYAGNWSACTGDCEDGNGIQNRIVSCKNSSGITIAKEDCEESTKPIESQTCIVSACENNVPEDEPINKEADDTTETSTGNLLLQLLTGSIQAPVPVPGPEDIIHSDSDKLFDWAETQFTEFFSPSSQISKTSGEWYYRYYPNTNNYLGVNTDDEDVYVFGDIFGGLVRIDTLEFLLIEMSKPIVEPTSTPPSDIPVISDDIVQDISFPLCTLVGQPRIYDPADELIFNVSFYRSMNRDIDTYFGNDDTAIKQHWINSGISEGRIASPAFDVQYYLNNNQDLKEYFGSDYEGATRHWFEYGLREGRSGSPIFDVQYYLSANPDLYEAFGSYFYYAAKHWLNNGSEECRIASHSFQPLAYLDNNMDLKSAFNESCPDATLHWLVNGQNEGRKGTDNINHAEININCNKVGSFVPEPTPEDNIPIEPTSNVSQNTTNEFKVGDTLQYNVTFDSNYYGSGFNDYVNYNGVKNTYYTQSEYGQDLIKVTTTINISSISSSLQISKNDINTTISNHFLFNNNGAYLYKLSDGTSANPINSNVGVFMFPGVIELDMSWVSNYFMLTEGIKYNVTETYSVVAKEILSTPFGDIEAYKIISNLKGTEITNNSIWGGNSSLEGSANVWFEPKFGVIKEIISGKIITPDFESTFSSQLDLINHHR